jgi:hypothetical protein
LLDTSPSGHQNSRFEKHYKDTAEEAQSILVLVPQAERKTIPPRVQEEIVVYYESVKRELKIRKISVFIINGENESYRQNL